MLTVCCSVSVSRCLLTMARPQGHFGYQIVRIIKTSSLGVGSYGAVYRALCDELPCAAKILHPTLFETNDPGARKIIDRFEQECQFLSGVRHPHIVQYLGVSRDSESGLPVLLMELMDSSLTRYLERSEEPLPFHIQVDLCQDIVLALAYLHSNGIIHRDLSSNNVLLIGNRAKVTDFGMSKLSSINPRMTPMTMCPGTLAYMPPEALKEPPVYSKKLDCFSFGVVSVQMLTCQFPDPGVRFRTIDTTDPRIPSGTLYAPIPEIERRRSHIDLVDPAHPLLPVALDCLKDRDRERPSAPELCHSLAALKEAPQYGESVQQAQRVTTDGNSMQIRELRAEVRERQREMEQLQQQLTQQIQQEKETDDRRLQEKDRIIENNERQLQEKDRIIANNERQLQEKARTINAKERQLRQLNQQLQENEQVIAGFQHKHLESEQRLVAKDQQQQIYDQPPAKLQVKGQSAREGPLSLSWKKCGRAPCTMRGSSSVVDGNTAYFIPVGSKYVYSYNSEEQTWSALPPCPHSYSSLAVVSGLLIAIGGGWGTGVTNQLFSLTGQKKWVEHFPPMSTERCATAAVCSGTSLVVAGGIGTKINHLDTVEVMNTENLQWSTASRLPFPLSYASATICQDRIYLLGYDTDKERRSVLACSMAGLRQSSRSPGVGAWLSLTLKAVWHRVADLPVHHSTCATLCGQLLAVGGKYKDDYTTAIHQYNAATNSWEVISHMPTARSETLVAVLPGNKLMVVGGYTRFGTSNTTEIATLQE